LELDILKPAYRIVLGVAKESICAEFEGVWARLKCISKVPQAIHQRLFWAQGIGIFLSIRHFFKYLPCREGK